MRQARRRWCPVPYATLLTLREGAVWSPGWGHGQSLERRRCISNEEERQSDMERTGEEADCHGLTVIRDALICRKLFLRDDARTEVNMTTCRFQRQQRQRQRLRLGQKRKRRGRGRKKRTRSSGDVADRRRHWPFSYARPHFGVDARDWQAHARSPSYAPASTLVGTWTYSGGRDLPRNVTSPHPFGRWVGARLYRGPWAEAQRNS